MPSPLRAWALKKRAGSDARDARDEAVVRRIQKEAKGAGATLANDGRGGLDPRLALKVFRRDRWRCTVKGCAKPRQDLDLDHIGGHPKEIEEDDDADAFLRRGAEMEHEDDPDNLHVICARHHDDVHDRERALEDGEEPAPLGS